MYFQCFLFRLVVSGIPSQQNGSHEMSKLRETLGRFGWKCSSDIQQRVIEFYFTLRDASCCHFNTSSNPIPKMDPSSRQYAIKLSAPFADSFQKASASSQLSTKCWQNTARLHVRWLTKKASCHWQTSRTHRCCPRALTHSRSNMWKCTHFSLIA